MTIQARITALAQSVGADIKALFSGKQDTLVSGSNIKTVNGESLLGEGNVEIESGGLTLFAESTSTTAPNDTVPAHSLTPVAAQTDVDFVITPKGSGAILAQVPDGTANGGVKRGNYAVDLQRIRPGYGSAYVASGAYSVTIGYGNRASGAYSVALGYLNQATGLGSVALGYSNQATGSYSFAIGGGCTASGIYATALGGDSRATGSYSTAAGSNATASGYMSASIGSATTASGDYSQAFGRYTSTRGITGAFVWGNSNSGATHQLGKIPLRWDTTSESPQKLSSDGAYPSTTNTPVMPDNSAYDCIVRVVARNTTTNECKRWSGTALIRRGANAASTTLVGSSISSDFGDPGMDACTVTLSADTTRGGLAVIVTGLASTTVRWVAQIETVEAA